MAHLLHWDLHAQLGIAEANAGLPCGLVLVALKLGVPVPDCLHRDGLASHQLNVLAATEHGGADLRALGVQQGSGQGPLGLAHLHAFVGDRSHVSSQMLTARMVRFYHAPCGTHEEAVTWVLQKWDGTS
ncbi:hypothetical protein HaLaN_06266 [Haematococcus lacustris]|uniref:Uncharacterized protein n=1 Tax=Haematococcus lacustris TaxID=44745 RepID=A0A699YLG1_HAELA|nr:hypothetical protein HaLaN_06266 [Haematococcus lacustris]